MPDETVLTEEEKNKDKPLIVEVRDKSFDQILREQAEARKSTEETPTDEDKKKEEDEKAAKEAQDAKDKIEAEEADTKRQQEIATKAAQEVVNKQKAEEQAKIDAVKSVEDEVKRQESLKPKFTGKDKDDNTVPMNYEEIVAEGARIGKEEALATMRAEQAEAAAKAKTEQDQVDQTKVQQEAAQKGFQDQLQKELDEDLKVIYLAGDLPKINDPKDENELGNKEFKNLFETAQKVNGDRVAKGLTPIRSIQVIRYGKDETGKPYYTPLAPPAGHDSPVLGNESPISREAPDDKFIPGRDRGKTMTQMIKEEAARLSRKVNVRGN